MENSYLIPANTKKSQLILGIFNMVDLIVFISGVGFSVLLLLLIKSDNLGVMLGLASPAIVSAFLMWRDEDQYSIASGTISKSSMSSGSVLTLDIDSSKIESTLKWKVHWHFFF